MSNLNNIIPFTELVERAMNLARDDSSNTENKFKGLVNDAYTKDIPRVEDWDFLLADSSIACSAYYNTGTVTATAGSASITGSGTTWTSAMTATNGWKIKFTGNSLIYDFTRTANTTATISPVLSGDTSISSGGYVLYRDTYSLASDFSRFLLGEEGGLKLYRSGKYTPIPVVSYKKWRDEFRADPSDNVAVCRLRNWDSSLNRRIQINPATRIAIVLPYDYVKVLTPMTEYTTGYISAITNASTGVTGSGTAWNVTGNIDTSTYAYYLRVDADGTGDSSVWYKIDSVGGATSITLASNYGGTTISTGVSTDTYTVSRIPEMPGEFHQLIIYFSAMNGIADQGDPNYQYYLFRSKQIMDECKVLYKSRRLSHQFGVVDDYRSFNH